MTSAGVVQGGPGGDRALRMGGRVERAAEERGLSARGVRRLSHALEVAMEPRRRLLPDDHDPRYLHPARVVLILLEDVGCVDSTALAAAALVESRDWDLRVPAREILRAVDPDVARFRQTVPVPEAGQGAETIVEALVLAPRRAQLVALAERLDHLRHLHLASAADGHPEEAARLAKEARDVYLPLAERVDATLHRRFRWWCERVGKRWQ